MKSKKFITMTSLSIATGFVVGLVIGKKTREAAPNHIKTSYDSGVVTIRADIGGTVQDGIVNSFTDLF